MNISERASPGAGLVMVTMARGPRKKAAELALRQGNPGRRSRSGLEAAAGIGSAKLASTSDFPAPPDLDPAAVPYWHQSVAWLTSQNMLKGVEPHALARYCEYYAMWRSARAAMADRRTSTGIRPTYETKTQHGTMRRVRPEWKIMMDCERELKQLGDRFGFTPAARASLFTRLAETRDTKPLDSARRGSADAVKPDGPIGAALAARTDPPPSTKH